MERLADALEGVVKRPLSSPFARECIVVQGPGMERWLAARLAQGLGVWANPWFPFPRALVELVLDAVLGALPDDTRWDRPEALTFRIAQALPGLLARPAFASLAGYFADDAGQERTLSVADELARAFDQCMVYRPEQILAWERGDDADLHAELWRALSRDQRTPHLAQRLAHFHAAFARGDVSPEAHGALPERIALFGLSALPPAFLSVLARASTLVDVHLFLLTPSQEYWGDLDRKLARGDDLHALLATLGKVGRDLVEQLAELPEVESDEELFEVPAGNRLLDGLIADLATLTSRGGPGGEPPRPARPSDASITVQVCHSELRELEVLRDQLRARLEADPTLAPHDIVVLTPDIERYASVVHAVFAPSGDDDRAAIPYHVADRKAAALSPVSDAFLRLLELTRSRLGLSDVLDLLHRPAVRTRFGIEEEDLDRVEAWLTEAGARWAIDAEHRASFDQPAAHENTLRFALDRLLVGYASAQDERGEFAATLPFCEAEGRDAAPLGGLARYLRTLFACVRACAGELSVPAWSALLTGELARMLSDEGELASEHVVLRTVLAELAADAERAHFDAPVSLPAFARAFLARLEARRSGGAFLSGGVAFCEHVPMRSLPFRIVCLVGLDDEAFPRRARPSSFDVLARAPRRGDRTLRDDDRQIFLEALLSARDALWISYVGRSAKDDTPRPASVLVDQLLALLDRHFVLASDDGAMLRLGFEGSVAGSITHVHALQRFDPRYFKDPRSPVYFSYDPTACEAARALHGAQPEPRPFATAPLAKAPAPRELPVESLVRFFRAPPRAFLEERLGVVLPRERTEVPDREPTALHGLDRYRVADDLLRELVGIDRAERQRILRGEGKLPPGKLGDVAFRDVERSVNAVERAVPIAGETTRKVRVELASLRITGRLDGIAPGRRTERIISQARGKHLLGVWLRHLVLCADLAEPCESLLVSREKKGGALVYRFAPVREPVPLLEELVALRTLGLRMPLPFFPHAAYECARKLAGGASDDDARKELDKVLAQKGVKGIGAELEERPVKQLWPARALAHPAELRAFDEVQSVDTLELVRRIALPMVAHLSGGES